MSNHLFKCRNSPQIFTREHTFTNYCVTLDEETVSIFFPKYDQCNGKIIDRFQNKNQLKISEMKKKREETLVYVYQCFGLIYPSSIEQ